MTDLRISAQQALEALKMMRDEYEEYACPACDHADAAIYALKEALVEDAMQRFTDVNQEIEAALAEDVVTHGSAWSKDGKRIDPMSVYAEPEQEPVANRAFLERILTAMEGVIDVADRKTDEFDALRSCVIDLTLMLHTAPPQRTAEPVQEPVAWMSKADIEHPSGWRTVFLHTSAMPTENSVPLYAAPRQRKPLTEEERNFCSRCGKRTNDIHTCTPPAPLTDEVIANLWHQNGGFHHHFARAIERWLRGHA